MATKKMVLNVKDVEAQIAGLKANVELLKNVDVAQGIVRDSLAKIEELEDFLASAQTSNKLEEFNKLFPKLVAFNEDGEEVSNLSKDQIAFIGEGLNLKLTQDGKLTFVKKTGAGGSGEKSPSQFSEYYFGGKTFTTAISAVTGGTSKDRELPLAGSVLKALADAKIVAPLIKNDSAVRELKRYNKLLIAAKLPGITAKLTVSGEVVSVNDKTGETATEAATSEAETEEVTD